MKNAKSFDSNKGLTSKSQNLSFLTSSVQVRYADTDAQGIVYHGAFFTFFEVARFDFFVRITGDTQKASGFWNRVAIVSARCEYRDTVEFPSVLKIETRVIEVGRTSFELGYRVYNDKKLLAEGGTIQVYLRKKGKESSILPVSIRRMLVNYKENNL